MYDVFISEMRCPNCGTVNSSRAATNMQTHIRGASADGSELGVGFDFHSLEVTTDNIIGSGYALIRHPDPQGPIRLLAVWTCPACDTEQWAMVSIIDHRIKQIESVIMSRTILEQANFISDDEADELASRYVHPRTEPSLEILRRHLPQ